MFLNKKKSWVYFLQRCLVLHNNFTRRTNTRNGDKMKDCVFSGPMNAQFLDCSETPPTSCICLLCIAPPSCSFSVSQKYLTEFNFKEGKFKLANSLRGFSAEVSCELEVRQNTIAAGAHGRGGWCLLVAKEQRPKAATLKACLSDLLPYPFTFHG